jgi:hypothetical protein
MAIRDLFHSRQIGARIGVAKLGKIVADLNARDVGHADWRLSIWISCVLELGLIEEGT